jgi:predicted metalloprotease
MWESLRRLSMVALVLFMSLGWLATPSAQAQDTEANRREASATADEILQLAVGRRFNAMYDRIHPDAQAVIPRAAAVGAFTAIYDQYRVSDAKVTGVDIKDWTWGVTGQTYKDTAVVHFEQSYVDANGNNATLKDDMPLVDVNGEWRWFFGSDEAFVKQMIEQYGQPAAKPIVEGDLITNVVNDLDAFYRDVLSYTGVAYQSPGVVVVSPGDSVNTACGPASSGFWGFYCPGDATLYLEEALLTQLQSQDQGFAAAFVIAHEWAHHIQTELGFERTQQPTQWNQVHSIELELMADCMAGAWALDVDTRGMLQPGDIDAAINFTVEKLGDPSYVSEYDPQAHGSNDQRVQSFTNGYEQGFSGCNVVM